MNRFSKSMYKGIFHSGMSGHYRFDIGSLRLRAEDKKVDHRERRRKEYMADTYGGRSFCHERTYHDKLWKR